MKLAMRVQAISKKVTLITTAFVLAVSTLTAAVPFVLAQNVAAAGADTATVYNQADLVAAAGDTAIKTISVKASFSTTEKIVLSGRNVYIDGNGNTISFSGDTSGWQGNYVFQAYKINLGIKNLGLTGGDAALYANGSKVNLEGTIRVSGNEFGGIEVSQGSGVSTPASLTVGSANLVNSSESNTKPTVWIDHASIANASVTGPFTVTTHIGADQKQYYLSNVNTGIVALNTTQNRTYATLATAVAEANATDTIQLTQNITLDQMVFISKALTLDGNNKTLTASYSYTVDGVDNAVLTVDASNVTVKNLTTTNISTGVKPHGIVAYGATGVNLSNVTLKDGRAGLVVRSSVVNVNGIHTSNNSWYGINVDKAGARLNIQGVNSHTETAHIYVDNKATGAFVVDLFGKYEKHEFGNVVVYVLDVTAPTVTATTFGTTSLEGAVIKGSNTLKATLTDGPNTVVNYTNFELRKDGAWKAQWAGGNSLSPASATTFNTALFADGSYTLRVYGRDNGGNTFTKDVNFTIDNTAPTISGLSLTKTVTNEATVTVSGTIKDDNLLRYRYQIVDASKANVLGEYGWSKVGGTTSVTDGALFTAQLRGLKLNGTTVANLPDGNYFVRVWAEDKAGTQTGITSHFYLPFTIDTTAPTIPTIVPIASSTNPAPTLSGTAPADATKVVVVIDGVEYLATVADGVWTYSLENLPEPLTVGSHDVAVLAEDEAGNRSDATFATIVVQQQVVTAPPTGGNTGTNNGGTNTGSGDTDTSGDTETVARTVTVVVPAAIGPAAFAGILGATDAATTPSPASNATEDVKGTSTEKTLAAAVDADNTNGSALGLAWYWWLLILAALTAVIWWIVAAVRNRQTQA